jgi:photosystem II stability/assembly factor-like uncharacterized protein
MQMLRKSILLLLLTCSILSLKAQKIVLLQQGKPTSIRGLSVVNDKIAWLSGSKGYVALTTDGGQNWQWQQVKGFESADFRSIEAFSDKEAIIMSSGTPALILKTIDGGHNWQVKYRNTDTTYFLDAMAFANPDYGLVLGDPIKNNFVLLETKDAGETWRMFENCPKALKDEAAFAASSTCLRFDNTGIMIVTGGNSSRQLEYFSDKPNDEWIYNETLLKHGKTSQGAFSVAQDGLVIVGGDYQADHSIDSVAEYYCYNGTYGSSVAALATKPPAGYQSCVERITSGIYLSTGTPGSNISVDTGKTWTKIDDGSFNVCRKAKSGKLVLLAGNNGRIAIFKP